MAKKRRGVWPLNPVGSRRFARHSAIVLRAISPMVRNEWASYSRGEWKTPARGTRRKHLIENANKRAADEIAAALATSITLERLSTRDARRLADLEREAGNARVAKTRSGEKLLDQARASMDHVRASTRLSAAKEAHRSTYFVERPLGSGRPASAGRDHFAASLTAILNGLQAQNEDPQLRRSFPRWKFAAAIAGKIRLPSKIPRPLTSWTRRALRKTASAL